MSVRRTLQRDDCLAGANSLNVKDPENCLLRADFSSLDNLTAPVMGFVLERNLGFCV